AGIRGGRAHPGRAAGRADPRAFVEQEGVMSMPPAVEELIAHLRAAAEVASQLGAAEADPDRASLLAGIGDVASCAALVAAAQHWTDRSHVVRLAHLLRAAAGGVLNDAEVLAVRNEVPEPVPVLVLERIEARAVTGW